MSSDSPLRVFDSRFSPLQDFISLQKITTQNMKEIIHDAGKEEAKRQAQENNVGVVMHSVLVYFAYFYLFC